MLTYFLEAKTLGYPFTRGGVHLVYGEKKKKQHPAQDTCSFWAFSNQHLHHLSPLDNRGSRLFLFNVVALLKQNCNVSIWHIWKFHTKMTQIDTDSAAESLHCTLASSVVAEGEENLLPACCVRFSCKALLTPCWQIYMGNILEKPVVKTYSGEMSLMLKMHVLPDRWDVLEHQVINSMSAYTYISSVFHKTSQNPP